MRYGKNVEKIKGEWYSSDALPGFSDNYDAFMRHGGTPEAAFETFTGKMAKSFGYDGVPEIVEMNPGYVEVIFTKKVKENDNQR